MGILKFWFPAFGFSLVSIFQAGKTSAQNPQTPEITFDITGAVEGMDSGTAWIDYSNLDALSFGHRLEPISFVSKISSGKFEFQGRVPEPGEASFNIQGVEYNLGFYIDSGHFSIYAKKEAPHKIQILGSKLNDINSKLQPEATAWFERRKSLDSVSAVAKNSGDTLPLRNARSMMQLANQRWFSVLENSVAEYSENYVALNMLMALTTDENLDTIYEIYCKLAHVVKTGPTGVRIGKEIEALKKMALGQLYPDFTMPDIDGKAFSLSSLKGHIVLLDFWSSFCEPCRAQNPNYLRAYQNFHGKGLEIVSISLDTDSLKWKQAVQQDNMIWYNISDLKGRKGIASSIHGIPEVYILDKNGIIVAKELSGSELYNKLEELCKAK